MATYKKKEYKKPEPTVRIPFVPKYPPSKEQEAIFDILLSRPDHLHIDASAGSGKSTTLTWGMAILYEILKERTKRSAMLAFSKAIVTEIEPRCAPNVEVRTAHSFGYSVLAKRFGRLFLSNDKVQRIFKEQFPSLNPDELNGPERGKAYGFMFDFIKLVDMLRANLLNEHDPNHVVNMVNTFGLESLDRIDIVMDCLPIVFKKMVESGNVIDYTDMMWLPIRLGLEIPKFDMLYVDERRDLNSLMIEYVFQMTGERIMTVGDDCQSIFGFAGADIHSTQRLINKFPGTELPLAVCYRCGTDIVELARTVYPKIMPFDKNPKGEVATLEELDWNMADGSMILSRRNASLVKPCFAFLRRGRKAIIKGKDIGASLLKLVRTMKASDTIDLMDKVEIHRNNRIEKLMKEKNINQAMVDRVNDECDCVREIAMGCDVLSDIEKRIETIFDEKTEGITLSSIHRSKGLEADHVTIVDYNRIRLCHEKMTEEQHTQEKNLHYVALTRAKKTLHLIDK